ncbi:transcriptional repressor [Zavarzinia sp. CC-PAN008]|uniref:transcriptional repressor n=1 Tax=Zavarzinia sp. CC-PAN008 TaxID=3243332 RepID=UPI003F749ADA
MTRAPQIPALAETEAVRRDLDSAALLCVERGASLTPLRRTVLSLVRAGDGPTGAYDLITRLGEVLGRPVKPPTVYRALDFLVEMGLVRRIESRNAFVSCAHPEHEHTCVFFVCTRCGTSAELEDDRIVALLAEDAATLGFHPQRPVIEVEGLCRSCGKSG